MGSKDDKTPVRYQGKKGAPIVPVGPTNRPQMGPTTKGNESKIAPGMKKKKRTSKEEKSSHMRKGTSPTTTSREMHRVFLRPQKFPHPSGTASCLGFKQKN